MDIANNLQEVKEAIATAAAEVQREAAEIDLVAVSKVHEATTIQGALEAGHRVFGENRVQEALTKWPTLKEAYSGVTLHLIGSLQTNKVKEAVSLFDVIETVDRVKLARALAKEADKQGREIAVYIQVNTGEEDQKGGCSLSELDELVDVCRNELKLKVLGLMCIPPVDEEPSLHFAFLREKARAFGFDHLSMGMSGDYETAVRFGATSVRVGTAIFGQRPVKK